MDSEGGSGKRAMKGAETEDVMWEEPKRKSSARPKSAPRRIARPSDAGYLGVEGCVCVGGGGGSIHYTFTCTVCYVHLLPLYCFHPSHREFIRN